MGTWRAVLAAACILPALITSCRSRATLGRLAYVHQGGIWVKDLPKGRARRLTEERGLGLPRWSASGAWIACLRGLQLCVIRSRGGTLLALEQARKVRPLPWQSPFAWSPADDRLAWCGTDGKLRVSQPEGRLVRTLEAPHKETEVGSFTWSPDGRAIAWGAVAKPESAPERAGVLVIASVEDGRGRILLERPGIELIVAGWTPDGRQLVFWSRAGFGGEPVEGEETSLEAIAADGGRPRLLASPAPVRKEFVSLSPRDSEAAFTEGLGRETWTSKRVAIVDLASGKIRQVSAPNSAAFAPAWSPDGLRIAFVAGPDAGGFEAGEASLEGVREAAAARRIWIANRDGSVVRRLTGATGYQDERPQWSAEGRHILFARLDRQGRSSLWLADVSSGETTQVAPLDLSQNPAYPPGYYGYLDWDSYFDWRR